MRGPGRFNELKSQLHDPGIERALSAENDNFVASLLHCSRYLDGVYLAAADFEVVGENQNFHGATPVVWGVFPMVRRRPSEVRRR